MVTLPSRLLSSGKQPFYFGLRSWRGGISGERTVASVMRVKSCQGSAPKRIKQWKFWEKEKSKEQAGPAFWNPVVSLNVLCAPG